MEVTFGAVGDFISIGVLIKDLIELLDDSRGSAWEYQSLREQLVFLGQNLDRAKDQYHELRGVAEFRDICDALEAVVDEAEKRLEQVAAKINKYTSTLAKGSTQRSIKKIARKVQWSLEKSETEKFLIDLNRYVGIVQSLQLDAFRRLMQRNLTNSQNTQIETQQLIRSLHNDFTNRITTLEDELRAVRSTSSNTQQYLLAVGVVLTQRLDNITQAANTLGVAALQGASGIRWFGTSVLGLLATMHASIMGRLERPPHMGPFFTFEDYLGVEATVLLDFIDSWEAFEGTIKGKYKGKKGGRRVAKSLFLLQERGTGREVDRDMQWALAIAPGSHIDMSLIYQVEEDEDEAELMRCPHCKAICEGVIGKIVECPACKELFRKLQGLSSDEQLPFTPDAPTRSNTTSANASKRERKKQNRSSKSTKTANAEQTTDAHDGSDSDDADIVGIKRVAVQPVLRAPNKSDSLQLNNQEMPRPATRTSRVVTSYVRPATEADAKKHRIPAGYSLKHWDPDEEPFLIAGSVFDADSLGKWIYDWAAVFYEPGSPTLEFAGELWLSLIQLSGRIRRAELALPSVNDVESKEMVGDFIDAGERLTVRLKRLLKSGEKALLKAAKKKPEKPSADSESNETKRDHNGASERQPINQASGETEANPVTSGSTASREAREVSPERRFPSAQEFMKTLFDPDRELEKTEKLVEGVRLWGLRFDANVEPLLRDQASKR